MEPSGRDSSVRTRVVACYTQGYTKKYLVLFNTPMLVAWTRGRTRVRASGLIGVPGPTRVPVVR